ncbi:holin [Lactobacillus phage CR191]|nr:holin [Lactobacillus phage CR191]
MMEHEDLGKTKLDHVLSYIAIGAMKFLEFTSILFLPLLVVQQLVIYGTIYPDQILSLLFVLLIISTAYGYKLVRDWRNK